MLEILFSGMIYGLSAYRVIIAYSSYLIIFPIMRDSIRVTMCQTVNH